MTTRTEDQIATVHSLRPSRRTAVTEGPAPAVLRGPAREPAEVVELARARRRVTYDDFEPQGGDAA
jgi:hypothetical protein